MSKFKPSYKNFGFEIKAVTDEGIIEGYASVFDNIDLGDDIVERGAFKKTIRDSKGVWPILHMHDPRVKLGYNIEAKEDDHGLYVREQLELDVQAAREQYSLTKLAHKVGGKDGLSIGYGVIKAVPDKERPSVRRLKELKMWEHSHVTFGMNQEAATTAAKSWQDDNVELSLKEHADLFFNHMQFMGFDLKEVRDALHDYGAAKKSINPDKAIQSIDRAINILRGT